MIPAGDRKQILKVEADWKRIVLLVFCMFLPFQSAFTNRLFADRRNIRTGFEIPSEGYADQPYVVITKDGDWLCTLTTGKGIEGQLGQHVVGTISRDKGKTWSELIDIEPADGPEASWIMPLITPSGRIYVFYDYNGDDIRKHPSGRTIRADVIGWYCYRYSDDGGMTWSKRHRLPVRVTACDRANDWGGAVQMFWGISKPIVYGESMCFAFTKLGKYMLDSGEGWFFRSDNVISERDVSKIRWLMLPEGEHGLRAPQFGSIQEEHNIVALSNGDLYCMYRTTMGYPVHSYSRDVGRNWSVPTPAVYRPGGRRFKHPRACPRIWRCGNGKFLFWFHNHGGKSYKGRNPVWICGGIERGGLIHWSEPEILLYDDDREVRISYPDLIEQGGRYWITETQKETARVHEVDASLLEGLWLQGESKIVAEEGLVLSAGDNEIGANAKLHIPKLSINSGLSVELRFRLDDLGAEQVLLDSRDDTGKGLSVATTGAGAVVLTLSDGENVSGWDCDTGLLKAGKDHHVVFIVDGEAMIISVVVDGVLCDGGEHRQYGWGRCKGELGDVNSSADLRIAPSVGLVRIYDRYLRTSEAIGNFRGK